MLFYGEGYTHKFSWTNNIWALTIEARMVKCAIVETFEKFLGKDEIHFSELETKRKPSAQPDLLPVYLMLINYVAVPQAVKEEVHTSLIQAFENPKSFYDEEDEFILSDRGLTFATHKNLTPKFVFIDKLIEANQMAEVDWKADEEQIRFSINKILAAKNFDFKLLDEIKYSVDALGIIQSINNLELKPAGYALALLDIDSDSYVFTVVLLTMQKEVEELFAQL